MSKQLSRYLIFCAVMFTSLLFISCKKKERVIEYTDAVYEFYAYDSLTNEPLQDMRVLLLNFRYPATDITTPIGYTDNKGYFKYVCNKESINEVQYYSYWWIGFTNKYGPDYPFHVIDNKIPVDNKPKYKSHNIKVYQASELYLKLNLVTPNHPITNIIVQVNYQNGYWEYYNCHTLRFNLPKQQFSLDTILPIESNRNLIISYTFWKNMNSNEVAFKSQSDTLSVGYNNKIAHEIVW